MRSLADLEGIPSNVLTIIPKATLIGWYLPHQMMAVLVLAKQYLSLRCIHPSLPDIQDVTRQQLDGYLLSWSYVKGKGLFPCVETIKFDGNSEICPSFRIELTVIFIKHGLQELFFCAKADVGDLPEHLFFLSMCLGRFLCMAANNCPLRWPMHKGGKCGVSLLLWMKIKYESEAKIDPLNSYYHDKLWALKLRVNGILHDYIDKFQGLAILLREINPSIQAEEKLVTHLVSQIEDTFSWAPAKVLETGLVPGRLFVMPQLRCMDMKSAIMLDISIKILKMR